MRLARGAFLLLVVSLAGCGRPTLAPVQGKVAYRGFGLNNGVVVFAPEHRGPLAVGRIGPDGSFSLYTGESQGALPGRYRVTISSLAPGTSTESWGTFEFPRSQIPDRYRDPETSRLAYVVVAGKVNNIEMDLNDRD